MSRVYNYKFQKPDERDLKLVHPVVSTLPTAYDIRSVLGEPIVFDQGNLGSCTSQSSALMYMFMLKQEKLAEFVPSRLFIYAISRMIEGTPLTEDSGADLRDVMKAIQKYHVCAEAVWPYDVSKFSVKPPQSAFQAAVLHKEFQYLACAQTETAIKTALTNNHAIVFGIQVYESFESDEVSRTGIVPMPDVDNEQCLGGHALTIVGFDDSKQAFGVQNSWNSSWGLQGLCWIPYSYVLDSDLASDFWVIKACN